MTCPLKQSYTSPRWSGEVLDCSMPMTFDQYSRCSFDCLYCFAFFQRGIKHINPSNKEPGVLYTEAPPDSVNIEATKALFNLDRETQFSGYLRDRTPFQWGGMSDPFDLFEKQYGVGLELLKTLDGMDYPICFSTKGTWWADDERYMELFRRNPKWNVKVSIINWDENDAKKMERGVPSPSDRIELIRKLSAQIQGGVTLRLRPFIIGYTSTRNEYLEVIRRAAEAGASAISTEFLCIESRITPESKQRFDAMSQIMGFDMLDFYRVQSGGAGYLRLNWAVKAPYVDAMQALAIRSGMRFYVSDAHHKDRCSGGSCCGMGEGTGYSKGQFTAALVYAREAGKVGWDWMAANLPKSFATLGVVNATGLNIARGTVRDRARFKNYSIADYMQYIWNNPNHPRSPYKYFHGLLHPTGLDSGNNVIYEYRPYECANKKMVSNRSLSGANLQESSLPRETMPAGAPVLKRKATKLGGL